MNEILITRYVSAWAWHILAMLFLVGTIILLVLDGYIWAIALIVAFIVSECMAWKRKQEVYDMENGR